MNYLYDIEKDAKLKLTDANKLSLTNSGEISFELANPEFKFSKREKIDESEILIEDLMLWLKADKGVIIDESGGVDTVVKWEDQSKNGYHLTQLSKTAQPLFQASGLNNLPTLLFQDYQFLEGDISLTYYTAYIVSRFNFPTTFGSSIYEISTGRSVNQSSAFFREGNNDFKIRRSSLGNFFDTYSGDVDLEFHIFTCEVQDSLCRLSKEDLVLAESTDQITIGNGLKYIVGGLFDNYYRHNGSISEIIFYSSPHNESQKQFIKKYLKEKYKL